MKFLGNRREDMVSDGPARRIVLALAASLLASMTIGVVLGGTDMQVFEASGVARRFGLPLAYLLLAAALVLPSKNQNHDAPRPRAVVPLWWWWLGLVLIMSVALAVVVPRQNMETTAVAESSIFIVGFLIAAALGFRAAIWTPREEFRLLAVLATFAMLAGVLQIGLGSYVAMIFPAAAMLLYAAVTGKRRRVLLALLGAGLASSLVLRLLDSNSPSTAEMAQGVVCAGILLLALLPKLWRFVVGLSTAAVGIWLLATSGVFMLMLGDGSMAEDVTLAHRAYEAHQVGLLTGSDLASLIFGLGPAATVDLSGSPDAVTLQSSGRILSAVDDVHFLTSWLVLKLGLLGLLWFAGLLIAICREAAHIFSKNRPRLFESGLLLFIVAGLVHSFPAATYFFSNPLPALLLGILYSRRVVAREKAPLDPSSTLPHQTAT